MAENFFQMFLNILILTAKYQKNNQNPGGIDQLEKIQYLNLRRIYQIQLFINILTVC